MGSPSLLGPFPERSRRAALRGLGPAGYGRGEVDVFCPADASWLLTEIVFKSVCRRSALHPDPCSCTCVRPLLGASCPKPRPRAAGGPRNRHQGVPPPWTPRIFAARQADGHPTTRGQQPRACMTLSLPHAIRIATWMPHEGYYTWPLAWPLRKTCRRIGASGRSG